MLWDFSPPHRAVYPLFLENCRNRSDSSVREHPDRGAAPLNTWILTEPWQALRDRRDERRRRVVDRRLDGGAGGARQRGLVPQPSVFKGGGNKTSQTVF